MTTSTKPQSTTAYWQASGRIGGQPVVIRWEDGVWTKGSGTLRRAFRNRLVRLGSYSAHVSTSAQWLAAASIAVQDLLWDAVIETNFPDAWDNLPEIAVVLAKAAQSKDSRALKPIGIA